ncbi:ATP-binding cassette domain-containing protein [Ectopseudomonas toyotomiensis]|uniref:ATP-binding cassette domain-containing protein n=1 Tax=Ectopseudomonas toyotomiensis TaxID=554344 RepID=A0ABD7DW96_9GAMM|nr:ATP-binding cassette domain-containing protein [Pseudomonas toyotomiensis]QSL92745.1 ATP-binding cassette domain-containing protein [Pseudomonas toyotomiensis]
MITCRNLQWGPAGRPLTPPLDLHLPRASLTAVIGSNGCGKSSLLKVIAGIERPLSGQIELSVAHRGGIAYLVQQQALDRQFPIKLQDLVSAGLWRSTLGRPQRRERLQQALRDWDLEHLQQHSLRALSGGELQRALLARLSLTDAQLLLLDEPEAALDESGIALLWQHIQRWQAQGRTLLIVSHALDSLNQRLGNALLVAASGCRYAPIRELLTRRSGLEKVA